jgi:hypothetical protein
MLDGATTLIKAAWSAPCGRKKRKLGLECFRLLLPRAGGHLENVPLARSRARSFLVLNVNFS